MELRDALAQIAEIREHVARTETFRGYRSAIVAFSAMVAWGAAGIQAFWIGNPADSLFAWLALWITAAAICVVATGAEMAIRSRRQASPWAARQTWLAVEQFAPCLIAGGLITVTIARFSPETAWMLPGVWAVLFSLGIFASCRLLPRATFWVGAYYLFAGVLALALARGEHAFSPWAMIATFGVGQTMAAGVLYWFLERCNG